MIPLGNVATVKSGFAFSSKDWKPFGTKVVKIANVKDGYLDFSGKTSYVDNELAEKSGFLLSAGQIVIGMTGDVGHVARISETDGDLALNQRVGLVKVISPNVDPNYLYQILRSSTFKTSVQSLAYGSVQPNISPALIESIEIPLPRLERQKDIAAILDAFDNKIASNNEIISKLDSLFHSSWKDLYLKIPENQEVSLTDLVESQYGFTTSAIDNPDGMKFLRVMDINKTNWITWENVPSANIDDSEIYKYKLNDGDLLVARMADPGKCAIYEAGSPPAIFASYLVRLVPKTSSSAHFIYGFLKSDFYKAYVSAVTSGTVQKNMNAKVIVGTSLKWPTVEELRYFSETMSPIRKVLNSKLQENTRLISTRKSLLPILISGRIELAEGTL